MDGHVEEVPCSGPGLVLPPAPACLGPVEEPLGAEVTRLAKSARPYQVAEISHRGSEPVSEGCHVHYTGITSRFIHLTHFQGAQCQRLLAHHMLTCPGRGNVDWTMRVVGTGNHDRVDIVRLAQGDGVGRRAVHVPLSFPTLQERWVRVADGHEPGA